MKCIHLETKGESFTNLPETLDVYNYGCGVIQLQGKLNSQKKSDEHRVNDEYHNNRDLFLCCDIVEDSYVGNIKVPVLRHFTRNGSGVIDTKIQNVIWLKVERTDISRIKLYLTDRKGEIVSFDKGHLTCTLLFIPNKINNEYS